jgi:predicted amidophosphoribosyltransferase
LILRLSFASALVYSTRGTSQVSFKSRRLRDRIKRGEQLLLDQIAEHVKALANDGKFPGFFDSDVALVPVPGHAPLAPGAVSTTERIAIALRRQRLGGEVVSLLERAVLVNKSAFALAQDRPRANDHLQSLALKPQLINARRFLLVDDFVTRGATLIGASSRIEEGFKGADIRGFALVRSMTDGDVPLMRDSCVGDIEMDANGETRRRP